MITTYLGSSENVEVGGSTFLSQSFCVPEGATTLNFKYNVISEEAKCGVDERFTEDTFKVFVFDDDGNYLGGNPLVSESSSTSDWFALDGNYFYGGDEALTPGECHPEDNSRDDGTFHTDWKTLSLDISNYAGLQTPLTLYFEVNDGGDLIYDTVVGIDDVFLSF